MTPTIVPQSPLVRASADNGVVFGRQRVAVAVEASRNAALAKMIDAIRKTCPDYSEIELVERASEWVARGIAKGAIVIDESAS